MTHVSHVPLFLVHPKKNMYIIVALPIFRYAFIEVALDLFNLLGFFFGPVKTKARNAPWNVLTLAEREGVAGPSCLLPPGLRAEKIEVLNDTGQGCPFPQVKKKKQNQQTEIETTNCSCFRFF